MKKYYDIIFVVLVYRNVEDLKDFFKHLVCNNSKTIVVESFFSKETTEKFKDIAKQYDADFIPVPNLGYGAGNNRGCRYAIDNYKFDYLIVSNADVIIKKLDYVSLKKYDNSIIAPKILNLKGKNQNPSSPFKFLGFSERLAYIMYKGNHTKLIWLYFALSRLKKMVFHITKCFNNRIFSAHGAFVIFPKKVIDVLFPLYNEEMFLFNEEEHLGRLAASKKIKTYYNSKIEILHKEDGSIKISSINEFELLKQSFLVYYKHWFEKV